MIKKYETTTTCYVCNSENIISLNSHGDKYEQEENAICLNCSAVFNNPRIGNPYEYYTSNEFSIDFRGSATLTEEQFVATNKRALFQWAWSRNRLPQGSRVLEVGSGSGAFLRILSNAYETAVGLEISTSYAEATREDYGLNVITSPFEEFEDDPYDSIFMFHAIEHMPYPDKVFSSVRRLLKPGGYWVVEYPDLIKGLSRKVFNMATYFQASHLFNYHTLLLAQMALLRGFHLVDMFSYTDYPSDKNNLMLLRMQEEPEKEPTQEDYSHLSWMADRLKGSLLVP